MSDQPTMSDQADADWARGSGHRKPKKKVGGRKKGSKNKKTLQKLADLEKELQGYRAHKSAPKLAVDHMDEMIEWLRNLVGAAQAFDAAGMPRPGYDPKLWFRILDTFAGFLAMRAPYQSARLSAVLVHPAAQMPAQQKTTVNVTILNERGDKVYSDADDLGSMDGAKLIEHVPTDEEAA